MFRKLFKKKEKPLEEKKLERDIPLTLELEGMYENFWLRLSKNSESSNISLCIKKPRDYAVNKPEIFEDRGIDWKTASEKQLRWIGLVGIALENNFVFEIDYASSLDEFTGSLVKMGVVSDFKNLNPEEDIESWIKQLDIEWKKHKKCFYMLDIDSDSYVLFVSDLMNENYFKYLSKQLSEKIKRAVEPDKIEVTQSMFNIVLDQFDVMNRDYASITLIDTESDIFSSKLGGLPYLDADHGVPTNNEEVPLRLLAQINMKDLPSLSMNLPTKGLLQFWIENNDVYGLSFNEHDGGGFLVRFIENLDTTVTESMILDHYRPKPESDSDMFPFEGSFGMEFSKKNQPYPLYLDSYQELFIQKWSELNPSSIIASVDEFGSLLDDAIDASTESGHKIGGFPFFTQYDPRLMTLNNQNDYEVLLFQLDTDRVGSREIMWGDLGITNFFISNSDLENLDFTKVLYNWDCY
ncbi:MAG: YwqG family protein [Erysipelothrix sp.]